MLKLGTLVVAMVVFSLSSVFAQPTRINVTHTAVNVTTSSTEVIAAKTMRGFLLIVNDSDTTLYCKVGASAVVNEGIRINANGGSFEMGRGGRNIDTRVVNCIHGGTGNKVALMTEG